jgi:hypothetical protein
MVEVAPDARDPRTGEAYAEIVSLLTIPSADVAATSEVL